MMFGAWSRGISARFLTGALLSSTFLTPMAGFAQSLPVDGVVTSGKANISRGAGADLRIDQSSDAAILSWGSFSIGDGARVQFNNGDGATLNRVRGNSASRIDGALGATGSVYLVNENGVVVGPGGVVETGGSFVASTLDVSDADFKDGGDLVFGGQSTAKVLNFGRVGSLGGDVALIASRVENHGLLAAPNGTAGLVAGQKVLMRDTSLDAGMFSVLVGSADSYVLDEGSIAAANAELRANGGNVYALAGNSAGVISASGVAKRGGRIFLTGGNVQVAKPVRARKANGNGGKVRVRADVARVSNLIDVSGLDAGMVQLFAQSDAIVTGDIIAFGTSGMGGRIAVTADRVHLQFGSRLDASGQSGGGAVSVGGAYQGGPGLSTADRVLIEKGAALFANAAGDHGDGGTVVAWSDEITGFAGLIEAKGGALSGDGGLAEVSGKESLSFAGIVDLSAPGGATGALLLDPVSIEVTNTSIETDTSILYNEAGPMTVSAHALLNATAAITLQATEDITFTDPVSATQNISAEAGRDILVNADLATTGNLSLIADADLTGIGGDGDGTVVTDPAASLTAGGALVIAAGEALSLGAITAGFLDVVAKGSITDQIDNPIMVSGLSVITAQDGANAFDIALDNAGPADSHDFGGLVRLSGEDIIVRDRNALVFDAVWANTDGTADTTIASSGGLLTAIAGAVVLGSIDADSLSVTAAGAITDTPGKAVSVTGVSSLTAYDGVATYYDIILDNPNLHDFDSDDALDASAAAGGTGGTGGDALFVAGRNVFVEDIDRLVLGAGSYADADMTFFADDVEVAGAVTVAGNYGNDTVSAGLGTFTVSNRDAGNATMSLGAATAGPTTEITAATGFNMTNTDFANITASKVVFDNSHASGSQILSDALDTGGVFDLRLASGDVQFAQTTADLVRGDLIVEVGTSVTQTGSLTVVGTTDVTVADPAAGAPTGTMTLSNTANDFQGIVSASAQMITIADANDLTFGDVDATGNLTVKIGGALSDDGDGAAAGDDIDVAGITMLTAGGPVALDDAFNDFAGAVSSTGGAITLSDRNALELGNITATGPVVARAGGDLTVGGTVSGSTALLVNQTPAGTNRVTIGVGGNISTSATSGDAVVIAADGFDNQAGAQALARTGGRFLIYVDDYAADFIANGLVAGSLYNRTYDANPPSSIAETGDRFVFGTQPTLTISGRDTVTTYDGTAQTLDGYDVSGLVNGDTLTDALSTDPSLNGFTDAGVYDTGTLTGGVSDIGYKIALVDGVLTIEAAPIEVTADPGQGKVEGEVDPVLTYTMTGGTLFASDGLSGDLTRESGEAVGEYPILVGSLTAGPNYDLTFIGDVFTITSDGTGGKDLGDTLPDDVVEKFCSKGKKGKGLGDLCGG